MMPSWAESGAVAGVGRIYRKLRYGGCGSIIFAATRIGGGRWEAGGWLAFSGCRDLSLSVALRGIPVRWTHGGCVVEVPWRDGRSMRARWIDIAAARMALMGSFGRRGAAGSAPLVAGSRKSSLDRSVNTSSIAAVDGLERQSQRTFRPGPGVRRVLHCSALFSVPEYHWGGRVEG